MSYSRLFVALNQNCDEYTKDIRGCVGRCIIEVRNGAGRFVLQAQGLSSETDYRVVLLSEDKYADIPRQLYVGGSGKGEIRYSFDPDKLGVNVDDIRGVAVLVMDKAPLIGFTKGEYNWQRCLMAETINNVKVAETSAEKAEVISIIEKIDENIEEIKTIVKANNGKNDIFDRENIQPFGNDNIKWVKAGLKDLPYIRNLWKYTNNPYVVYCCSKYQHILLGKDSNNYWLALPCKYDKSYKLEAKLQGFNGYKAPEGKDLEENEFCYCIMKC